MLEFNWGIFWAVFCAFLAAFIVRGSLKLWASHWNIGNHALLCHVSSNLFEVKETLNKIEAHLVRDK